MNFIFHDLNGKKIAELPLGELNINSLQDSIDMIGNAHYLGSSSVVIYKECLSPDFFKLSSGLAGDILQKISRLLCNIFNCAFEINGRILFT